MSFLRLCRKPAMLNCILRKCIAQSSGREEIKSLSRSTAPFQEFYTSAKCLDDENQNLLPGEDVTKPKVKLTFIRPDGVPMIIYGRVGLTVIEEAERHNLPVEGFCKGCMECGTCHLYVESCKRKDGGSENPYLEGMTTDEEDSLEITPFAQENSRLSCQLIISPDCENAVFKIPYGSFNFTVGREQDEKK